ncbi:hypothetical protein [Desemzia sp. FAM 23991]|uniref:hypothetical protein n=1 Tax=unclassified Desemzia TaxID=2685243 RepID=UPI00388AC74C
MKKLNKLYGSIMISIGSFVIGTMLIFNHYALNIPDFLYGLCYGIGFAIELMGIYTLSHDVSKLKKLKINFFKKTF